MAVLLVLFCHVIDNFACLRSLWKSIRNNTDNVRAASRGIGCSALPFLCHKDSQSTLRCNNPTTCPKASPSCYGAAFRRIKKKLITSGNVSNKRFIGNIDNKIVNEV